MIGRVSRLCALVAAATLCGASLLASRSGVEKTLILGVVDASGRPVKDLAADHFRIREDRTDREILSVKPSSDPLQIVLMVDTTKETMELVQELRRSLGGFVRYLHQSAPDAQ